MVVDLSLLDKTVRFRTWLQIMISTCGSHREMRSMLGGVPNFKMGDAGSRLLSSTVYLPPARPISLVRMSGIALGFKVLAKQRDIYARALSLGLRLVPAEAAPHLRKQYLEQPDGEWLQIGMTPLFNGPNKFQIFSVASELGDLWLHAAEADPERFWEADCEWVFRQREGG